MKTRNWKLNNVKDFFWVTTEGGEGMIRIRIGVKSRSNVGMFKHTKSKKASNSQLEFQTHVATDGRHLFLHSRWNCDSRRSETEAHPFIWMKVLVMAGARTLWALLTHHANSRSLDQTQGHVAHPGTDTWPTTRSPLFSFHFFNWTKIDWCLFASGNKHLDL